MSKKHMNAVNVFKLNDLIRERGYKKTQLAKILSITSDYFSKTKLEKSGISDYVRDKLELFGMRYDDYRADSFCKSQENHIETLMQEITPKKTQYAKIIKTTIVEVEYLDDALTNAVSEEYAGGE